MTDGRILLAGAAVICVLTFFNGLRFARMSAEQTNAGRLQLELPAFLASGRSRLAQVQLLGRMQMIAAPLMLLFFIALTFGLLGPVDGIQTIKI